MEITRGFDATFATKLNELVEQLNSQENAELSNKDVIIVKKLLGNKWENEFWAYNNGEKESFCPFDSKLLKGLDGLKAEMQSDCARFSRCKEIVSWIFAQAYKVNTIYMVAMTARDLDGLIDLAKVGTAAAVKGQATLNRAISELNDNIFTILAGLFYSFNL